jgi:hypothetical protein
MRWMKLCAVVCVSMVCSVPALAGFTPINPPPVNEATHQQIFSAVYGGNFVPTGLLNLDYSNGTVTATRVHDFPDPSVGLRFEPLSLINTYGSDDQLWLADFQFASAEAKFAVFEQNFGYFEGEDGMTYHKLFDQSGLIYNVSGEANLAEVSGKLIRWARGGEDRVVSSRPSDNEDGMDHMVTYLITGLDEPMVIDGQQVRGQQNSLIRWLVFFEDKFQGEEKFDFDFNDLVVEITALPVIPEPSTLALAALGSVFGLRRRHPRHA